jgi:hypothetical protein
VLAIAELKQVKDILSGFLPEELGPLFRNDDGVQPATGEIDLDPLGAMQSKSMFA